MTGATWDSNSHVVIDSSDGSQDINMPAIAQLSSGDVVVTNHRLVRQSDRAGRRRIWRPIGGYVRPGVTPTRFLSISQSPTACTSPVPPTWAGPGASLSRFVSPLWPTAPTSARQGSSSCPTALCLAPFRRVDGRRRKASWGLTEAMGSRFFVARSYDGGPHVGATLDGRPGHRRSRRLLGTVSDTPA